MTIDKLGSRRYNQIRGETMDNELLTAIEQMLDKKLDEKLMPIHEELASIKQDTSAIWVTIENEIRPAINQLAEGHMSLSERLDRINA